MNERKYFQNSIKPLPAEPGLTPEGFMVSAMTPDHPDETLEVRFALNVDANAEAALEARVAKGETATPDEIAKMYSADPSDTAKLTAWLTSHGYKINETGRDHVYASAKASQIARTLDVRMLPVTRNGITYLSAQNAPSLPVEVAGAVRSITGLQPHRHAIKHLLRFTPTNANRTGPAAAGFHTNIANAPPYLVSEMLGAYNGSSLAVSGKGQTIAILIDTFPDPSDLQAFWNRNGLPVTIAQVDMINVSGGTLPAPSGEETLDASWSSGVASGARIRIYASGSLSFVALDKALDRIIADLSAQPGMRQLSISLGLGEQYMAQDEVDAEHTRFLHLAASGVNVFVSTGDAGSNPDQTGHGSGGPKQAEYQSTDSAVIAVGGTTLRLKPDGSVKSETGWSSGGGGTSQFFPRPAWQTGPGVKAGANRTVPDVCAAADPNTGAFLVLNGQSLGIGGTSWSAPMWAGFCALINEARGNNGKAPLGYLPPLIYPLNGTNCFRDITSGSNGAYHCGPGYDEVTGIGSPSLENLIAKLT
ncbi:MAG: S8/S53 family peptidase [Acidobacteriota bacterium]|nr:S8/S53 family peptidase [Acidobacteriota bacterium]